ncbi:neutral amino acid permease [Fusarium albosuccineum]|uniref:Neutral amino acid permease n=1 Tax=Fusarium albosuccineum TaxID=1237068 RepID=A0A8H4LJX4_9HYPO|nr:neutral amino acid permease [Fusarium albosuccineum]
MESKDIQHPKDNGAQVHDTSGSDSEAIKPEYSSHGAHDFQTVPPESDDNANIYSQGGKNFRTLKRWDTIFILFANQIGLGILSLPSTLKTLGIIPGLIALIGIGVLSWYTAYELLQFYRLHPQVVNGVEMTRFVGGSWLEGVAGVMMMIQVIFVAASAIVTLSIALNTISDHATCTVVFIFVAVAACYLLCIPRTTKFVSHLGIPNAVSVLAASILVMISLGIKGPREVTDLDEWDRDIQIVGSPSFRDGLNACLKITFAYAANLSFVGYMAEMVDPIKDFKFCLGFLESSCILLYSAFAIIFYCLGAEYTTSPILGATSVTPARVAYGVVLPAIYSTGLAYGHIGAKYIFVNVMRWTGSLHEVTSNTVKSWATWVLSVTSFWIIVFILSNAIPVFDSILSITSATTISWFTYGFSAVFWFNMNWHCLFRDWKKICLTLLNAFLIAMSLFMNAAGLWASITELLDIFASDDSTIRGVFSCGSNAQF